MHADVQWAATMHGALDVDEDEDPLLRETPLDSDDAVSDSDLLSLAETPTSSLTQEFTHPTTLSSLFTQQTTLNPPSGQSTSPESRSSSGENQIYSAQNRKSRSDATETISQDGQNTGAAEVDEFSEKSPQHVVMGAQDMDDMDPFIEMHPPATKDTPTPQRTSAQHFESLQHGLEGHGSSGRKFEEILRWFPKRKVLDAEAQKQDAILRRLSFQAHAMLGLPRSFAGTQ
jgi:hypothetical protein